MKNVPHAKESEIQILGAILTDSRSIMPICMENALTPDDFFSTAHATIYKACTEMHDKRRPLDIPALVDYLRISGSLDSVGGSQVIHQIFDQAMTTAHTEHHIAILKEKRNLRNIMDLAREVELAASEGRQSASEILQSLTSTMPELQSRKFNIINAADFINSEPPPKDPVIENCFETGDKVLIVASSKMKKSFFVQQMAFCIASGSPFLGWSVPHPRRTLIVQYEIKELNMHRRIRYTARGLNVSPDCIGDRFQIINARGCDITLPEIEAVVRRGRYEVVIFDPLYKLLTGDENKAEDMKPILATFDRIAHNSGAAVIYVHHDAKGNSGDRNTRDRGAGSGILIRDIDHGFMLSPQADAPDCTIIETLGRNNPETATFVAAWSDGCFTRTDIEPSFVRSSTRTKKTDAEPKHDPDLSAEVAEALEKNPYLSAREIAKKLKCHYSTISRIRKDLRSEEVTDQF